MSARRGGSRSGKPRPLAAAVDTFSGSRGPAAVRRQLEGLAEIKRDAKHVANFHIVLGMTWALEWMLRKNASPGHILRTLADGDTYESLMKEYAGLTRRIDTFMAGKLGAQDGVR